MYHRTAHVFHLIMTILTGFLWVPIWIFCTISNNQKNQEILFRKQMEK